MKWSSDLELAPAVCTLFYSSQFTAPSAHWFRIDYSGEVFKGTWNNTQVALKVLKTEGGVMPSSTARR
jgi:hypothetical protein